MQVYNKARNQISVLFSIFHLSLTMLIWKDIVVTLVVESCGVVRNKVVVVVYLDPQLFFSTNFFPCENITITSIAM